MSEEDHTTLTKAEHDMIERIAKRDGVSLDEAATRLAKEALARRVKRRTGKSPARVYSMKGK